MIVEIFDLRLPEIALLSFKANNKQEAHNIGRAKIIDSYIAAHMDQGVIFGRYEYRIKEG